MMPIVNASSKSMVPTAQPNMSTTVRKWLRPMTAGVVTKTQQDYQTVENISAINFYGVFVPDYEETLDVKKVGERSWAKGALYCLLDTILVTDSVIILHGKRYRIMGINDYIEAQYIKYRLVEDYNG